MPHRLRPAARGPLEPRRQLGEIVRSIDVEERARLGIEGSPVPFRELVGPEVREESSEAPLPGGDDVAGDGEGGPEPERARERHAAAAANRHDGVDLDVDEDAEEAPKELGPQGRHVSARDEDERLPDDLEGAEQGDERAWMGRRVADEPNRDIVEVRRRGRLGSQNDDRLLADRLNGGDGVGEERATADRRGKLVGPEP